MPAGFGMVRARTYKFVSLLVALVFWATSGAGLVGAASPQYSWNPIPLAAGWSAGCDVSYSQPCLGINDSGQVAGSAFLNASISQVFIGTASGVTPIPLPTGWAGAQVYGINNSGQAVGWGINPDGAAQAFIGTDAGITPIPLPAGWTSSQAFGINDSGQVVGLVGNYATAAVAVFVGTAAGITPIPLPPGWSEPAVNGINHSGEFVGWGGNTGCGCYQAFVGTAAGITPIPLAGWTNSWALGINDLGQVVGYGDTATSEQPFVGTAAGITPIPLPAGWTSSEAVAINGSGQVVGWGQTATSRGPQPLVGTAAGIAPIPLPAGSLYFYPYGINNSGQVVGLFDNPNGGASGYVVTTPGCQVNVPLLSQRTIANAPLGGGGSWGTEDYDSVFDEEGNPLSIAARGCALTSLTMALNFALTQNSSGASWNPGTLNSVLFAGGYGPQGIVQWASATLESNLVSVASGGPTLNFDYLGSLVNGKWVVDSDKNLPGAEQIVEQGICGANPHPVIVAVRSQLTHNYPGHFVLITGEIVYPDGTKAFTINDPYYPTTIIGTDESTGNKGYLSPTVVDPTTGTPIPEFQTRGIVTTFQSSSSTQNSSSQTKLQPKTTASPSTLTELSVSVDAIVNLIVTDPNGLQSGFSPGSTVPILSVPSSTATLDEIDDDITGDAGGPVQSVLINQPTSGTFQLSLTGVTAGQYSLIISTGASDGTVQRFSLAGATNLGATATYQLNYSPVPGATSPPVLAFTDPLGYCDISGDGSVNVSNVETIINEALGVSPAVNDLSGDGVVNALDIQIEINAALGSGCAAQ